MIRDEMRYLADEMSKAISTEIEQKYLADERKLEAVLKENGWRKASEIINEFSEELIKRFNDLEYKANTPRKTIRVDELRAQMDWILHEVAINTIKEFAEKYVEAIK